MGELPSESTINVSCSITEPLESINIAPMSADSEDEELASLFMAGCNGGCAENEPPMNRASTNSEMSREQILF